MPFYVPKAFLWQLDQGLQGLVASWLCVVQNEAAQL